ncbi:Meiosis protein mei2 [Saitozyma sp. JCM 24511]|nr:Meiosis protein mei2 [Saitozyma sp. JCM 24511]
MSSHSGMRASTPSSKFFPTSSFRSSPLSSQGRNPMTPLRTEKSSPSSFHSAVGHERKDTPSRSSTSSGPSAAPKISQLNPGSSVFQPLRGLDLPDIAGLTLSEEVSTYGSDPQRRSQHQVSGVHSHDHYAAYPRTPGLTSSTRSTTSTLASSNLATPHTPRRSDGHSSAYYTASSHPASSPTLFNEESQYGLSLLKATAALDPFQDTLETAEEIGRYLLIQDIPKSTSMDDVEALIHQVEAEYKLVIPKDLSSKGTVIVAFYDPREAAKVYRALQDNTVKFGNDPLVAPKALRCMRIDRAVIEKVIGFEYGDELWAHSESRIVVEIVGGRETDEKANEACLKQFGDVQRVQGVVPRGKKFIAEYWDTRYAAVAVRVLQNARLEDARVLASFYSDDQYTTNEVRTFRRAQSGPAAFTLGSSAYKVGSLDFRPHDGELAADRRRYGPKGEEDVFGSIPITPTTNSSRASGMTPRSVYSLNNGSPGSFSPLAPYSMPYSPSASRRSSLPSVVNDIGSLRGFHLPTARGEGVGTPWKPRAKHYVPAENVVFEERVRTGLDPRTTIMIKDVPNKLSRQGLVQVLDEVVPGEYDFVYLRFDFKNSCNVGYAFVNFVSVQALYRFVKARVGKRWNMFSSEKVLQVSYANIQGKEALVNKFRNSTVMEAHEDWRPLIFYSDGAKKGWPEPFPEVRDLLPSHLHHLTQQPDPSVLRSKWESSRSPGFGGSFGSPSNRFDDSALYDYASIQYDPSYGI